MLNFSYYPLTKDSLADLITVLNLKYPGKHFIVSKTWFQRVVAYGFVDDCHFSFSVSKFLYIPLYPELC